MRDLSILLSHVKIRLAAVTMIIVLSLGAFTPLSAKALSPIADTKEADNFLQEAVRHYKIPGLSVAIVSGDGVIFNSGYGEASPGVNVVPDTPFLLGSTTKTFTALAVMRLVEQGKIDLDTPIKGYLPEFKLAECTKSLLQSVRVK